MAPPDIPQSMLTYSIGLTTSHPMPEAGVSVMSCNSSPSPSISSPIQGRTAVSVRIPASCSSTFSASSFPLAR